MRGVLLARWTRPIEARAPHTLLKEANLGWETLLNRAGTTFRKLDDADKDKLTETKAIALMLAQPSMIKRPVLDLGGKLLVGFKPEIYAREVAPSGGSRRVKASSAR